MPWTPLDDLIQLGYLVQDADNKYAGEIWTLPGWLRTAHDNAFTALRDAAQVAQNANIAKEEAAAKRADEDTETFAIVTSLKYFIDFIADEKNAVKMKRRLGIDDELPADDEQAVSLLMGTTIPHLSDWDGTPTEFPAAMKADITAQVHQFAIAVNKAQQKFDESVTATAERDTKRQLYEKTLARIRSWLYLNLPDGRYDERLNEYGFNAYDPATYPIPDVVKKIDAEIEDGKVRVEWSVPNEATHYELQRALDVENQAPEFATIAETELLQWLDDSVEHGNTYIYRVRGVNRWAKGKWSKETSITIKEKPAEPVPPPA